MTTHHRQRPLVATAVIGLLLLVGLASGCTSGRIEDLAKTTSTASPPSVAGSNRTATASRLDWQSCGELQCATLEVPLDWSKPDGKTIGLHLARKPATGTREGSVLFNFGGPGEAGGSDFQDYVDGAFDRSGRDLGQHFDLVSWDPRGTGKSDGVACTSMAETLEPDLDPTPDTPAETTALRQRTIRDTQNCLRRAGSVLPYVDTWSTVRDLDAIGAALGDGKLTYVGFSYGTELGMSYLATYPTHVRAMVLDGIALPQDPISESHDQAVGFEKAVETFLRDCTAGTSSCSFGDGNAAGAFAALSARLEAGARIPASGTCSLVGSALRQRKASVGIGELDTAVAQAMYDRTLWPILGTGLSQASRKSDPDAACLLVLRDYYAGIRPDGSLDHLLDSFHAISCADQAARAHDPLGDHPTLVAQWSKELPLVGGQFAEGLPGCWGFPAARHPLQSFTAADFADAPPVVVIGNTGDPATPFSHAEQAHTLLPGSVLVTYESTEHTVYLTHGSTCVDQPVTQYLLDGRLPRDGIRCKP
ncbi:MAG TPA: alpha/beta hydrolase [Acidimicrobiales bacterium]|nr:alpha/beta hydrolase [Acidimicrobiales bacterium]